MPRTTRVPGHVPLGASPLFQRKPASPARSNDGLGIPNDVSGLSKSNPSFARAKTPAGRLSSMINESNVAIGGSAGGTLAILTTLKSDLVMLQAEIDATTRDASGALELQSTLSRFTVTEDDAGNVATCNTLMGLILLKINELARLHSHAPSTAPRQSRVGDVLAYFRGVSPHADRPAQTGSAVEAYLAGGAADTAVARPGHTASASGGLPGDAKADGFPTSQEVLLASDPDVEVMDYAQRGTGSPLSVGGGVSQSAHSIAATAGNSEAAISVPDPDKSPSARMADALGEAQAEVVRLEKQLLLFRYLEPCMYQVDHFDSTLRHCTMNETMQLIGIDMPSLLAKGKVAIPPHTLNKQGIMKPVVAEKAKPAVGFKAVPVAEPSADSGASDAEAESPPTSVALATAQAPAASDSTADVAALRSLVAFQNAVVSILLLELKAAKVPGSRPLTAQLSPPSPIRQPAPSSSGHASRAVAGLGETNTLAASQSFTAQPDSSYASALQTQMQTITDLRANVRRLEAALESRNSQLATERSLHMLRHERAATALSHISPQSPPRASTAMDSRPESRVSLFPTVTDLAPPTVKPMTSSPGFALPRLGSGAGDSSNQPLLATRVGDVPGTAEVQYRRTIAQQSDIIRDLQKRVDSR